MRKLERAPFVLFQIFSVATSALLFLYFHGREALVWSISGILGIARRANAKMGLMQQRFGIRLFSNEIGGVQEACCLHFLLAKGSGRASGDEDEGLIKSQVAFL
jgi:hypothetical protein